MTTSERLRVLYLTHHSPWPAASGGRLRDAALIPQLARHADLEVWAVSRRYEEDVAAAAAHTDIPVRVFRDESRQRAFPTRHSETVRRLLAEREAGDRPFDVVHVEGHYLTHLLPDRLAARSVLVEHNIESSLVEQKASFGGLAPENFDDFASVRTAELQAWRRVARVVTLSEEDHRRVRDRAFDVDVRVVPNGSDHTPLHTPAPRPADQVAARPRLGFLANYAYSPNQDAVDWMLDEVFERIRAELPGAQLILAGSNVDVVAQRAAAKPAVTVVGWLDRVTALWDMVDVVICPLRIGGGVKVKMIEAIRGGCLIVSTGLGLEGLPPTSRAAVLRADDADRFAAATARLCTDGELRRKQRERVATAQLLQPTWTEVARMLHRHWRDVHSMAVGEISVH
ncbi:glycosyltransferase [Nocardia iowensis]|uniref:Glycosyltransferase n=1 Tax=Nocardia iowensis TaxID=204891 RepID=A0ABX8RM82_NOCIO|nr:glycosyltransferase [Nocardia iowensis]QXN90734.1 glycosyltransferase [Nocardia iowensis]